VDEDAQDQRGIDFFTAHLHRYADQLVADGVLTAKRRSYKLPHGTLQLRAKPVTFARNAEALLPWAMDHGLIRTKAEVDWEALKARLVVVQAPGTIADVYTVLDGQTGEIVPGVRVESPAHDEFTVKPSVD
jgi:phage host-nuclease inhibitor protein Gam